MPRSETHRPYNDSTGIVRLPGGKQIVIDAKALVSAYLEAAEAADDETRHAHLARHAQQVRTHMTALGRKAYWKRHSDPDRFVLRGGSTLRLSPCRLA